MLRWRPSALFGLVLTFPSIGFFMLFGARIAPSFRKMFEDFGGRLPFFTRIAVHPMTPLIIIGALVTGLVVGALRPQERFILLPLLAASGFVMSLAAMVALYLPIFSLADSIK